MPRRRRSNSLLRIVARIDILCVCVILGIMLVPAVAAVTIPIGKEITINVGELPAWVLSIAACVNIWMVWSLHQKTELIHKETNSMRAALEVAAEAKGKLEGVKEGVLSVASAKAEARADQLADAETAQKIQSIPPS